MEDWGDFTLNITVMPPEPASDLAGSDEEMLPTQPFRKPTRDQLRPKAQPQKPPAKVESKPVALDVPLPLRTGTLHSVAGLPLPPTGPRPTPVTPSPRATLDSLRATTSSQPIRTSPGTTPRPSSRITPAFGTRLATPAHGSRLTPPSGLRLAAGKRGNRPAAARRSRWAKDLLQRFNFDDCA
jgi:hypothetical protein